MGAVSKVFEPGHKHYQRFNANPRELLTETEYDAAVESTPNAHCTPIPVVRHF